jgi:hypothetical protein
VTLRRLGEERQETIALAEAIARLTAEARMPQA